MATVLVIGLLGRARPSWVGVGGLVFAVVALAALQFRPSARVAVAGLVVIWLGSDLWFRPFLMDDLGLVLFALLVAVAMCDPGVGRGSPRPSWSRTVGGVAAGTAALAAGLSATGVRPGFYVLSGFGAVLVALAATSPARARLVARRGHQFLVVAVAGAVPAALLISSLRFGLVGGSKAVGLGVALGMVAWSMTGGGRPLWRWSTLIAAVVATGLIVSSFFTGATLRGASGSALSAGLAVGIVLLAAAAAGLVPAAAGLRGRPIGAWALGFATVVLAVGVVLGGWVRETSEWGQLLAVGAGTLLCVALLMLAPWPATLVELAHGRRLRCRLGRIADSAARFAVALADRTQAGVSAVRAHAGPAVDWLAAPVEDLPGNRGGADPRRGPMGYWVPVVVWAAGAVVTGAVARHTAHAYQPELRGAVLQWPWSLDPVGRAAWGTGDYWNLANDGYRLGDWLEAVFPLVPLLVRTVAEWGRISVFEAQVAVSAVSGLTALVLFWKFAAQKGLAGRSRLLALLLVALYPYAFLIYGYGYSDPTLLALVLGSFVLVEARRPVLAGLVGALATATRPNAGPIIVALLVWELVDSGALARRPTTGGPGEEVRRWPWALDLRCMDLARWGVLLSLGGVTAYSIWMVHHAGDPLFWLTAQSHYGHDPVTRLDTWLKTGFLAAPAVVIDSNLRAVNELVHGVVLVGAFVALPALYRRLGLAYAAFAAGTLAIAWVGSRGFAAGARYLLPALPLYAIVVASWMASRPRVRRAVLLGGLGGMLLLVAAFAPGQIALEW